MDDDDMVQTEAPPQHITCIDCGGPCTLMSFGREDGLWFVGDVVTYRCRDCLDRWDLILEEEGF